MTQPPDEHGDVLRRVLRAEADAVVPAPDGLEIIRARIERRGVRNLFWWRAGAAAASAVLVAGTIVMVVPDLRQKVQETIIQPVENGGSTVPSDSSTSRSQPPRASHSERPPVIVTVQPPSPKPTQRPSETVKSTTKPSPTPTPTPCPTEEDAVQPSDGCPSPSAEPTTPPTEAVTPESTCGAGECAPATPSPSMSEATTPLNGAPVTTTPQQ